MTTNVVVTARGDEMIACRVGSNAYSQSPATANPAEPKVLTWGTGGITSVGTAAKQDVALFAESVEARVTGTSSIVSTVTTYETTSYDTYQVVGTITASQNYTTTGANAPIAEVGLFDSATKPAGYATSQTITLATGGIQGNTTGTTGATMNTNATFSPGNGNYVQLNSEVLLVTANSGTQALTVTRAANGSTKFSANVGEAISTGNAPGVGAGVTGGNLFLHASFSGLPLSSGDSLQSTIKVSFN